FGWAARSGRKKIRLCSVALDELAKVLPAQTQVDSQFAGNVIIVLEVQAVVIMFLVSVGYVRSGHAIGASHVICRSRYCARNRGEQQLSPSSIATANCGYLRIHSTEVEVPSAVGRLKYRKPQSLKFVAHFERLLS